jgi:hypothetical protein
MVIDGGERPPVAGGGCRQLCRGGECGGGGDLSQGRGVAGRRGRREAWILPRID